MRFLGTGIAGHRLMGQFVTNSYEFEKVCSKRHGIKTITAYNENVTWRRMGGDRTCAGAGLGVGAWRSLQKYETMAEAATDSLTNGYVA